MHTDISAPSHLWFVATMELTALPSPHSRNQDEQACKQWQQLEGVTILPSGWIQHYCQEVDICFYLSFHIWNRGKYVKIQRIGQFNFMLYDV